MGLFDPSNKDKQALQDEEATYANTLSRSSALGNKSNGAEKHGLLTSLLHILSLPRQALFATGKELADTIGSEHEDAGSAAKDWWHEFSGSQHDGYEHGFGDTEALKVAKDDGLLTRIEKGAGAFLGDTLTDPTTYLGGAGLIKTGVKGAMEGLASRGGAVLDLGLQHLQPEHAAEVVTKLADMHPLKAASQVIGDASGEAAAKSQEYESALLTAKQAAHAADPTLTDEAANLQAVNDVNHRLAGEQIGTMLAHARGYGSGRDVLKTLKSVAGEEAGTKWFGDLPSIGLGDVMDRVSYGVPGLRAYSKGGGQTMDKLLGDKGAALADLRNKIDLGARDKLLGPISKSGQAAEDWRQVFHSLNEAKGFRGDAAKLDDPTQFGMHNLVTNNAMRDATKTGNAAKSLAFEGVRKLAEQANNVEAPADYHAALRERLVDPAFELPADASASAHAGATAADSLRAQLTEYGMKFQDAGLLTHELDPTYLPRVLTEDGSKLIDQMRPTTAGAQHSAGGYNALAARHAFLHADKPEGADEHAIRLARSDLSPAEANALYRHAHPELGPDFQYFEEDPFEMMRQYIDSAHNKISAKKRLDILKQSGLVVKAPSDSTRVVKGDKFAAMADAAGAAADAESETLATRLEKAKAAATRFGHGNAIEIRAAHKALKSIQDDLKQAQDAGLNNRAHQLMLDLANQQQHIAALETDGLRQAGIPTRAELLAQKAEQKATAADYVDWHRANKKAVRAARTEVNTAAKTVEVASKKLARIESQTKTHNANVARLERMIKATPKKNQERRSALEARLAEAKQAREAVLHEARTAVEDAKHSHSEAVAKQTELLSHAKSELPHLRDKAAGLGVEHVVDKAELENAISKLRKDIKAARLTAPEKVTGLEAKLNALKSHKDGLQIAKHPDIVGSAEGVAAKKALLAAHDAQETLTATRGDITDKLEAMNHMTLEEKNAAYNQLWESYKKLRGVLSPESKTKLTAEQRQHLEQTLNNLFGKSSAGSARWALKEAGYHQIGGQDNMNLIHGLEDTLSGEGMKQALGRMYDLTSNPSTMDDFLRDYITPYMKWYRTWATVGRGPGFSSNNLVGGQANNFAEGVSVKSTSQMWQMKHAISKALKATKNKSDADVEAAMQSALEDIHIGGDNGWQIYQSFMGHNLMLGTHTLEHERLQGELASAKDLLKRATTHDLPDDLPKNRVARLGVKAANKAMKLSDNKVSKKWLEWNTNLSENVEFMNRMPAFIDGVVKGGGLKKQGDILGKIKVIKTQFDYSDTSKFDQRMKALIFPFWNWSKNNIPFQLSMIAAHPDKYLAYDRATQFASTVGSNGDQDQSLLPAWLEQQRGFISALAPQGSPLAFYNKLPMNDLETLLKMPSWDGTLGGASPINGRAAIGQLGPIPKTVLEQSLGINSFTGAAGAPTVDKSLSNVLPPLAEIDRLTGGQISAQLAKATGQDSSPQEQRLLSNWASVLGVPVATLTPSQESGELSARVKRLNSTNAKIEAKDNIDPSKLTAAINKGLNPAQVAALIKSGQLAPTKKTSTKQKKLPTNFTHI